MLNGSLTLTLTLNDVDFFWSGIVSANPASGWNWVVPTFNSIDETSSSLLIPSCYEMIETDYEMS